MTKAKAAGEAATAREALCARALRENLRRRKEQARERGEKNEQDRVPAEVDLVKSKAPSPRPSPQRAEGKHGARKVLSLSPPGRGSG